MVGGGGIRLAFESVVRQHEFFLALDARQDHRNPKAEALVRIASAIEPEWLEEMFPHEIRRERNAVYDEQRDRVVGHGTFKYRDLVLREDKDAAVDDETAWRTLLDWSRTRAEELLFADERAVRLFNRINLLLKVMPSQGWPMPGVGEILAVACEGKRSISELRSGFVAAIERFYPYPFDRLIETEAPETIEVPTGNRIRLEYQVQNDHREQIAPPILAVRLQEIFGWTETPRIAGGRVPVKLHLLAPNYRPVQITDDLKSFWSTTYFQVRKDLRVRYPKHSWPEDPLTATPQAKGSRRR
jgi:ATP-dependent helicase HrpB